MKKKKKRADKPDSQSIVERRKRMKNIIIVRYVGEE